MSKQDDSPGAGVSLSKTRLEAFSDGVFSIATTLLVLDIALHPPGSPLKQVLQAWPYYLAYLVSFLTIGGAWLAHTALTDRLTRQMRSCCDSTSSSCSAWASCRSRRASSPKRSTTSTASESSSRCTGSHCWPFASSGSRSTSTRASRASLQLDGGRGTAAIGAKQSCCPGCLCGCDPRRSRRAHRRRGVLLRHRYLSGRAIPRDQTPAVQACIAAIGALRIGDWLGGDIVVACAVNILK